MEASTTLQHPAQPSSRSVFDRGAFATFIRAVHPERRRATAVGRLTLGALDREPDVVTAWVYGAYAAVLGRLPDADGLQAHERLLRRGGSPADMVAGLAASGEARDAITDPPADLDEVFVVGAYLVALGRRPDPHGAQAQLQALKDGVDHTEVLASLLRSSEAKKQLRFPPATASPDEHLARAVQEIVAGDVDPDVHRLLVRGARRGRSVSWMVCTALHLRAGRRALVRALPRTPWVGHVARRRARSASLFEAVETSTEWNWRVLRTLMDDVERLSKDVAALRSQVRAE